MLETVVIIISVIAVIGGVALALWMEYAPGKKTPSDGCSKEIDVEKEVE